MLCVGCFAKYQAGNRIEPYVLFALPGGMNTANLWIDPRETPISLAINSRWCGAGSNPLILAHWLNDRRV
jgi:hypothetical protein